MVREGKAKRVESNTLRGTRTGWENEASSSPRAGVFMRTRAADSQFGDQSVRTSTFLDRSPIIKYIHLNRIPMQSLLPFYGIGARRRSLCAGNISLLSFRVVGSYNDPRQARRWFMRMTGWPE